MLYRNEKTGAIIDVNSVLGGDWKPVKEKAEKTSKETKKKTETRKK